MEFFEKNKNEFSFFHKEGLLFPLNNKKIDLNQLEDTIVEPNEPFVFVIFY
jgi:hypothetical protein